MYRVILALNNGRYCFVKSLSQPICLSISLFQLIHQIMNRLIHNSIVDYRNYIIIMIKSPYQYLKHKKNQSKPNLT